MKTIIQAVQRHARAATTGILACALALVVMFSGTRPLRSDNFVFYLPASHGVIPIQKISKSDYLPLLQILNLVGRVDALQESSHKLRVWFGPTLLEVEDSKRKVKLNKKSVSLSEPVLLTDGQWLVPVDFVSVVLPGMITGGVEYRAGDHRVFVGGAKPSTFSVHVSEIPNGARLRMEFTSPLTFQTAARDGKWILFLGDKPIQPLEQNFQFENPYVRGLVFDDQDGVPKLILTPAIPGLDLYPVLEEGGKVLRADVVKPVNPEKPASSETAQAPSPGTAPGSQPGAQEGLPAQPSQASGRVVVLDAGHGGQDLGAEGQNGMVEKNLVAQIVMRVRATLQASQKYRVILTRVGDADPDFNQRALMANTAHAAFFISFHAGNLNLGTPRVAVYSYQPPDPSMFIAAAPRPLFVSWSDVQAYHLEESARLAQAIRDQLSGAPGVLSSSPGAAPVRVLRNVDAPAVAIEVGSLAPNVDGSGLLAADFQQKVSTAVLAGLEALVRKPN